LDLRVERDLVELERMRHLLRGLERRLCRGRILDCLRLDERLGGGEVLDPLLELLGGGLQRVVLGFEALMRREERAQGLKVENLA
jgi:hypothetical protein